MCAANAAGITRCRQQLLSTVILVFWRCRVVDKGLGVFGSASAKLCHECNHCHWVSLYFGVMNYVLSKLRAKNFDKYAYIQEQKKTTTTKDLWKK